MTTTEQTARYVTLADLRDHLASAVNPDAFTVGFARLSITMLTGDGARAYNSGGGTMGRTDYRAGEVVLTVVYGMYHDATDVVAGHESWVERVAGVDPDTGRPMDDWGICLAYAALDLRTQTEASFAALRVIDFVVGF